MGAGTLRGRLPAEKHLTHTVTHTRKRGGGSNGRESAKDYAHLEQKGPQSAGKRRSEGLQSVGKDEVPGSNPGSSSKNRLKTLVFGRFCSIFARNCVGQNVGQNSDPHFDPHAEMCGKRRRVPDRNFRRFSDYSVVWPTLPVP